MPTVGWSGVNEQGNDGCQLSPSSVVTARIEQLPSSPPARVTPGPWVSDEDRIDVEPRVRRRDISPCPVRQLQPVGRESSLVEDSTATPVDTDRRFTGAVRGSERVRDRIA